MLLKEGMKISAMDVHGEWHTGVIIYFLEHTVIIENETEYGKDRYLLSKSELKKQGYSFSKYKSRKRPFAST